MAAEKSLNTVRLRAQVDVGRDDKGDLVLQNRNFNNIKTNAQPQELLNVMKSVMSLQQYDVYQIDVIETSFLQES